MGFRSLPYTEAEGKPQFAGMGSGGGSGGGSYTLPVATSEVLGGVKIGDGLSIDSDGILTSLKNIGTTPIKVCTLLGHDIYARVFENVTMSGNFNVILSGNYTGVFAIAYGVAGTGNTYYTPVQLMSTATNVNARYVGTQDYAQTANVVLFYY